MGSGKTLTFWMPLLFVPEGIQIVVTPLNILGKQNVEKLAEVGIQAISMTAATATAENFQAIADGKHRAIVTNVETLMKEGGGFEKLWQNKNFTSRILSVVWDESQCVSKWGDFRPEYKTAGNLRHLIPRTIPFFVTSATLPPDVLQDVMAILGMKEEETYMFQRSNDRPNIHLVVRKMRYPLNTYKDLAFLIPDDWRPGDPLPYKFLVFFDNIADSIGAAVFLRSRLPLHLRHKIKWFNSEMSLEFRVEECDNFKLGQTWGLACTESFGMGMDLPDITLVVQWRATCDMCTLWQRFGRGARDAKLEAIGLFLVEPMYFDETKEEKAVKKAKKDQKIQDKIDGKAPTRKRKQAHLTNDKASDTQTGTHKRPRLGDSLTLPLGVTDPTMLAGEADNAGLLAYLRSRLVELPIGDLSSPEAGPSSHTAMSGPLQIPTPGLDVAEHTVALNNPQSESESSSDSDTDGETDVHADRRAVYMKGVGKVFPQRSSRRQKKDGNELDAVLDDFINAGSETRNIKCLRVPPTLYFGSDKMISDHKACRPDLPHGCPRCVTRKSSTCCELCSPTAFLSFAHVDLPKPPPVPSRSRTPPYKASAQDMELRDALHLFRCDATTAKYGRACLKNQGPGIILSSENLQRIVDCAHYYKIDSVDHLKRETRGWASADEFGAQILALIRLHCPKPPPPSLLISTPLRSRPGILNQPDTSEPRTERRVKPRQCSKCKSLDHIASNSKCAYHPSHRDQSQMGPLSLSLNENSPILPRPRPRPRPASHPIYTSLATPSTSTPLAPEPPQFSWETSLFPPSRPVSIWNPSAHAGLPHVTPAPPPVTLTSSSISAELPADHFYGVTN